MVICLSGNSYACVGSTSDLFGEKCNKHGTLRMGCGVPKFDVYIAISIYSIRFKNDVFLEPFLVKYLSIFMTLE